MNLMVVENLCKAYGEKIIFDNISFGVEDKDKIGIIGVNGTGKSTLLRIIGGEEEADSGKITTMNGIRIAYLPQTPVFEDGEVVMDYMNRICNPQTDAEVSEAKSILQRLGISEYYKNVAELSGGQRKRVALAAAMIAPVDLLILDEPTNHIDNETIDWLEENLKKTTKALLMVTHDRYFLDRVVNKTLELDKGRVFTYTGNYTEFITLKAERENLELASDRKRHSFLRTEIKWIKRGAQARSTKQKARIERFEELSAIKDVQKKQSVEIEGGSSRLGRKTIEADHISKNYDGKEIIKDFSYIVLRDDRIGIIGKNGAGKSTLMNMLTQKIEPDNGKVIYGETVKTGVFAQENEEMDYRIRVIDYVKEVGDYITTANGKISASQLCEKFLFTPEMQYSIIGKLSGGERRRLYLLRVLMSSPNILFLDEPTNDLDIETLTILEDYIEGFNGAVIAVSHDRCFLDRCAKRLFAFEEDGSIKQFEGNYTDYITAKNAETTVKSQKFKEEKETKPQKTQRSDKKLKMSYNEQREFETIDDDIAALENKIAQLDDEMTKNASSYSKLNELAAEKEETENKLAEKMDRWVYLTELNEKILNG
jgi:ATP-binding cassette subfamily F protein uup